MGVVKRICNCKKNISFYCDDKRVKRSLLGWGARICKPDGCQYYEESPRPDTPPPPAKPNKAD